MLFDSLKDNNRIPFHMPGHKRNIELLGNDYPYDIDITEISGFDNLHQPEGYIKDIENKAKNIYNSGNSFLLVNGSTVGILAGVNSVVKQGDTVLISRNCHKSVYNALEIAKAGIVYLKPNVNEYGVFSAVDLSDFREKVELFKPKLIVVTSPTYEGVTSNVEYMCNIAHSHNIPVMVDAAHGAHMIDYFRKSSADIIVMSLHKTLPALTQCALAHIKGNLVDSQILRNKLSIFETSSPSYILMSSVESCLEFIHNNKNRFIEYENNLKYLHKELKTLNILKDLIFDDSGKVVIFTGFSNISGVELGDFLRADYNIEVEMVSNYYIVAMTCVCDNFDNYKLLINALKNIDSTLKYKKNRICKSLFLPEKKFENWQIGKVESIDFNKACGLVSAEYIWAYPPGIPIVVPGEVITNEVVNFIKKSIFDKVNIQSTFGRLPDKIFCKKV